MQRKFCWSKMSYPLKRKWERFQENFIVKCSLKRNPWPNTCKIYKDSYMIFIVIFWANTCTSIKSSSMDLHCNILLLKREFFFHSSYSMRLVKRLWVSCCKGFLNTRDGLSLCGSNIVKRFLQREWKISSGLLEEWM